MEIEKNNIKLTDEKRKLNDLTTNKNYLKSANHFVC